MLSSLNPVNLKIPTPTRNASKAFKQPLNELRKDVPLFFLQSSLAFCREKKGNQSQYG